MPITFTEEDFQASPAQPKAGFFSEQDFAPKPKRTPQQVMQEVAAAQASRDVVNPPETQGLLGQIAASPITGGIVNVASLRPVMTGIGNVASFIGNTIANDLNFTGEQQPKPFVIDTVNGTISQEPGVQQPFGAGRPMVQVPLADPQARMGIRDVSALPQVLGQLVEGLSTPENVATLPLAAGKSVGGQVAATLFAPQMISSGVESGMQALDSQLDPRAREEAAWNATINLLLGGKIGKGLLDARPWTPEVLPPLQRPVAPVGRQLPAPPEPFIDAEVVVPPRLPAPGERPTMPTGSPLDRPAGAARFGVDPTGKAVDISQLSPKEQIELYRGPKEFVPREQYVRPSQGPVPIVGEPKMMPNPLPNVDQPLVPFQNVTRPLRPAFVPSKMPVEPSGGEVSFRAPAQAQGVPSARQSALPQAEMPKREVVFQNETAPEAPAKPVVAKLSTSGNKNPLGDPMGSTYYATPEDWSAWQKVQTDFKELLSKGAEFDGPEMMKVRQENENIKNRYGGMPPVEPKSGGIGGGVKGAVDKNKEAGSVENPFARIVDKFKNKEKEKRGDTFALSGPRIALDPKESGFKDVTKKVDAQQLWNRVKNKLTPAERDIYEKNGVDKMIVGMGKVSPEEAAQMLQDGGVEVQTHSYGMEGKVSEAKKEYDTLSHSFYDNLTQVKKKEIDDIWYRAYQSQDDIGAFMRELSEKGFTKEEQVNAKRYFELGVQLRRDGGAGVEGPRATSAYDTVSAFSTKEPMPEWTKTRGGKNVQRVDVVVPYDQSKMAGLEPSTEREAHRKAGVMWTQDNLHENLPNTLGWAMIQYKDGPKGEKVAVVVEAQSRWGQEVREAKKRNENLGIEPRGANESEYDYRQRVNDANKDQKRLSADHPLLRDYNRLILKAAIDQARKEGATHIMVSDAETAMMTEGHDLVPTIPRETRVVYENTDRESVANKHNTLQEQNPDKSYTISNDGKQVLEVISTGKKEITQEPGMRLNYDSILPKIAEELTGSKGERVSLGEHKNALTEGNRYVVRNVNNNNAAGTFATLAEAKDYVGNSASYKIVDEGPRKDLIFRNPDGTPKTDVSGTMYKIPQTDKKFSVFEKDRPESVAGRLYINPVGPMAKQALKDIKKLGNGINETSAKLKEYFKGATDKVLPDLVFQNDNPLPDFQPKELANKIFSQPFGSEKIPVLGRMMGGKARLRTPQDDAVAAWYAERHGVGPAVASSVGEQIRGQIKEVFKVSKDGDLNVTPTKAGQSLKMSDVFEALRRDPMAYELTVPQRKVFKRIIEPITQRMTELANKYKIIDEVVDESGDLRAYYPRIVTKHPKLEDKNTSAFNTRAFNTEKEGWEREYEYELDPEKRLVTGVERLYRAIANKRLATDPILGAKSEVQLKAEIKQAYAEKLVTGEITQSKIDRIAEGIRTRGQVMQPILIRSIFDPETAKMLNKEFAAEQSTVRKAITSANSLMKATQLGFDLGVGQIQLLPLLYSNPKVWATAIYDSAKGMVNPEFFATYVRANKEAVNELAQLGSSVGRLQEHMSGLGGETILGKTPVVGQVAQAFGRQFQTAMDVAKVELWKSLREGTPKKEWPKLVRAVETALLSGRSESAMVPHGRALLERVALLAPSYYRGAVEHIAALGERGASGKVVRRSMGRFILGSAITFYAVAKALEMSDEEIKEGFNPMNTSFMTWKVKQEDGSVVNIGFGGIFRSFLKLGGNIIKTSQEHPENWKSLSSEKNPLTRWYRGHAGPTASMGWDAFSGEDFLGRETSLGTIAKGRLPLLAQEALRRPEEPPATALDFGASTFGLTTTPESYSNRLEREQNNLSLRMFGKEFRDLNFSQRSEVEEDLKGIMKKAPRGMTEDRAVDLAIKNQKDVIKNIKDNLGEENRKWLEKHNLKVGGFQNTFEIKGRVIRLTKDEREEMKKLMVEEYEKTLDELRVDPRLKGRSEEEMQRYVSVYLERARKGVWGKMNEKAGKK